MARPIINLVAFWAVLSVAMTSAAQPPPMKLQRVWFHRSDVAIESMATGAPDLLVLALIDRRDEVRHAGRRSWADTDLILATQRVEIEDLATGRLVHTIRLPEVAVSSKLHEGEAELARVRFSPDGKLLAISYLSQIRLYAVGTWREVRTIGLASEAAAEPAPNPGLQLRRPETTTSDAPPGYYMDGRTRVVDFTFTLDSRDLLAAYTHATCFYTGWYGIDCKSSGDDPVRLWDVATGKLNWQQSYNKGRTRGLDSSDRADYVMTAIAASPGGNVFATLRDGPGFSHVVIRSISSGDRLYSLRNVVVEDDLAEIAFAPDGSSFYVEWPQPVGPTWSKEAKREFALNVGRLAKYRSSDGAQECVFADVGGWTFGIFHDHRWVVGPTRDGGGLRIADDQTCQTIASVSDSLGSGWKIAKISDIRVSPDDRWIVAAGAAIGWIAAYRVQH